MRILISGVCGFVGSTIARAFAESGAGHELAGFDNFIRPGSEANRRVSSTVGTNRRTWLTR
mgnify:CR=1 FL=1